MTTHHLIGLIIVAIAVPVEALVAVVLWRIKRDLDDIERDMKARR